jgi:spore germination protein GerM
MSRQLQIILIVVLSAALAALFSLHALHRRVAHTEPAQAVEEQERRAVIAPPVSTTTDVQSSAQIFWVSATQPDRLAPVTVQLPLSSDSAERAKQLLNELISNPPTPAQRTLPQAVTVLDFYVLGDGTAIADFSDEISSEMPSGILSEWLAVTSIAQTLAANVPSITRLKILAHGQEAQTLAGHIDLSSFFDVRAAATSGLPINSPK